ncbi:MAG TPA: hypothetical protein VKB43_14535 [Gaiellaceae bacterium]|nr:hypothetical protein [Gaiellaceae bacterium]
MSSIDWMPDLAAALDELVPPEDRSRADWVDVVGRVRPRRRLELGQRRGLRLAIVVAVLLLLLAGVATATYLLVRGPVGRVLPLVPHAFPVLDARGHIREIPRACPRAQFCGDVSGAALSPDGKTLAVSTIEFGARSTFPGLHFTDLKSGVDWRIPNVRWREVAPLRTIEYVFRDDERRLGCAAPIYLSWSPTGSSLAYTCRGQQIKNRGIWTIRPDGTGLHLTPTHAVRAFAPSWSPDGKRFAFASGEIGGHSSVYVIDRDGRHERRLGAGAFPDWSPDGKTILYTATGCGDAGLSSWRIRLVTPDGRGVTPTRTRCAGVGPRGSEIASWSPDGSRIAVETTNRFYVMNANGAGLERLRQKSYTSGIGLLFGGLIRPLWQPQPKGIRR